MAGRMKEASRIAALLVAVTALVAPATAAAAPGDVYTSDFDPRAVFKLPPNGGSSAVAITAPGLGETSGMATGPDGGIYVGDQSGDVWRIDPVSSTMALFAQLGSNRIAEDLAFDAQGRLLILDREQNDLLALDLSTKVATPVFDGPGTFDWGSLAVMRNGDVFITTQVTDDLLKLSGGVLTPVDLTVDFPDGPVLSADERYLFFISRNANRVFRLDLRTGVRTEIDPGFEPRGIAIRRSGDLLVTAAERMFSTPFASASSTLFSDAAGLVFPGDIVIEPAPCAGRTPTVVGTDGKDVIRGSAFPDVISTLGGKDVVSGLAGNDIACGGPGKDVLRGGGGRDRLLGQGGKDKLIGGKGKDKVKGGKGKDTEKP